MKSILDTLLAGNARERLAVLSDIVSIIGISIATVIGSAFAIGGKLDIVTVGTALMGVLGGLSIFAIVTAMFLATSSWIGNNFPESALIRALMQTSLWLVFSAIVVWASVLAYSAFDAVEFTRQ